MLQIGAELKRKAGDGPKKLRIVGVSGNAYVCAPADEHASPELFTPERLRTAYGAAEVDIDVFDEQTAWAKLSGVRVKDGERIGREAEQRRAAEPTPEQVFAAAAAE